MANEENLIPFTSDQNREQAKKNGRKGGIASGISRRKKKLMKEMADYYLSLPLNNKKRLNELQAYGLTIDDIDNQMAIIVALCEKAKEGNARCAEVIFSLLGEDAKSKVEDGVIIIDDIL